MASSSSSLDTSANSYPSNFSFSSSSSSNYNSFMGTTSFSELLASSNGDHGVPIKRSGLGERIAERTGSGVPKFKSIPPPCLPLSPPSVSPSSYFAIPPGLSPTELLDSPVLLNSSHILPSPTTGSFANWKMNSNYSNNQQRNVKQEDKNNSDFSFQPPPPTTSSAMFQSSNSLIQSAQQQQRWSFQESKEQDEFAAVQVKNNISGVQSDYGGQQQQPQQQYQSVREQRRAEDGYNWRKYGQKQVKGSENPRSYYKCTYVNCPTKKKVERSLDGQVTEIVYKGSHNHPKPQSTRRSSSSANSNSSTVSNNFNAIQATNHDNGQDQSFGSGQIDSVVTTPENSSISMGEEDFDSSQKSRSRSDEYDEDEPETKRWKTEGENEGISAAGSRTVREPRVVVQTTSDIDILDDGYRWRKYGQKVVKGNPNPRSYYKCTHPACPVRKHVERASHDLRAVITTYEGKHHHDVPAARGSHAAVNRPLADSNNNGNSNISAAMAMRPSAMNHHHRHSNDNAIPLRTVRQPATSEAETPYSLEMFQSAGSLGFGGFGNQMVPYLNQTKDEPRDELFLESLLC
ncbi:WRKY transcription factor WRKY24-like [Mercurialis annua]|uniref:WRKY transcription factor WRKY24-like n=1 Tax=Mercurialis annua TaxID=3986 RepID=UPI00215FA108|nr:WRKY transcription factor WRKY24-like [Mercurialis annua]